MRCAARNVAGNNTVVSLSFRFNDRRQRTRRLYIRSVPRRHLRRPISWRQFGMNDHQESEKGRSKATSTVVDHNQFSCLQAASSAPALLRPRPAWGHYVTVSVSFNEVMKLSHNPHLQQDKWFLTITMANVHDRFSNYFQRQTSKQIIYVTIKIFPTHLTLVCDYGALWNLKS